MHVSDVNPRRVADHIETTDSPCLKSIKDEVNQFRFEPASDGQYPAILLDFFDTSSGRISLRGRLFDRPLNNIDWLY